MYEHVMLTTRRKLTYEVETESPPALTTFIINKRLTELSRVEKEAQNKTREPEAHTTWLVTPVTALVLLDSSDPFSNPDGDQLLHLLPQLNRQFLHHESIVSQEEQRPPSCSTILATTHILGRD
jgi:hypothetical protein